jgi:hypothetical protein
MFLLAALMAVLPSLAVAQTQTLWSEDAIVEHMKGRSRAYFPLLFRDGGFRTGMEVGVADGRYSELFLSMNRDLPSSPPWHWHMVEPFPNPPFHYRFPAATLHEKYKNKASNKHKQENLNWEARKVGTNARLHMYRNLSTAESFLAAIRDTQLDFLYLDGAHDYATVKEELRLMWGNVRPGGVLAGHDYCNYGEASLACPGCEKVPLCAPYSPYGVAHGKTPGRRSVNQAGVVRAVQEWLVESQPGLRLHHTVEDFTEESLARDGIDYSLVITNSYNPSWFVVKPLQ